MTIIHELYHYNYEYIKVTIMIVGQILYKYVRKVPVKFTLIWFITFSDMTFVVHQYYEKTHFEKMQKTTFQCNFQYLK